MAIILFLLAAVRVHILRLLSRPLYAASLTPSSTGTTDKDHHQDSWVTHVKAAIGLC